MKTLTILGLISIAHAGTIQLDSAPGLLNSLTAATVAIPVDARWQPNNPLGSAAVWISHSTDFVPFAGTAPVLSVFHDFVTPLAGTLALSVWADDTAEVLLDGVQVFAPNFALGICANGPIGCEPPEAGAISAQFAAGAHLLEFRLFQMGNGLTVETNPFGILYSGEASWGAPVPEPGTWLLAGFWLVAIISVWRKRRNV
jgi:hypothetical protein